jgi:hypothetical protein
VHRLSALTIAGVVAVSAGGVAAVSGGAQEPTGKTIKLVSKGGDFKFVDVPPKARSEEDARAGDQFALAVPLYSGANKRVGTLDARCTFTKGGKNGRGLCDGIYTLADGQIHVTARLSNDDDTSGSVSGGTGAYAGARGTFKSVDRPGEKGGDPSDETITLLP